MAKNGVLQLKGLLVRYCDWGGSSTGTREFIRQSLVQFAKSNPTCLIKTEVKRNRHPILIGYYLNGNTKHICVRNCSPKEIQEFAERLRNTSGRKVVPLKKPVISKRPSIQGHWHERMNLIDLDLRVEHVY